MWRIDSVQNSWMARSSNPRPTCKRTPFHESRINLHAAKPTSVGRSRMIRATASLQDILQDCTTLGQVRFIVVGDGAILESVSNFDRIAYNFVPNRGTLATISSQDKAFECHINIDKVKEVKFAKNKAKSGLYDIYATRFLGGEGKVMLSCILHGINGVYDDKAVGEWSRLAQKYGESVVLQ